MQLSPYTWNSHAINDGVNFEAWFPDGAVNTQTDSRPVFVDRTNNAPLYVYKGRQVRRLPLHIKMLGTIHSQIDTLKSYFNTFDVNDYVLVATDAADSDRQWYVNATVESMNKIDGQTAVIMLAVADPVWRVASISTSAWNITASASTHGVTVLGDTDAYPVLTITPTSTRANRYQRFVAVYNQTTTAFNNYPIEITNDGFSTSGLTFTTPLSLVQTAALSTSTSLAYTNTTMGTYPPSGMLYVSTGATVEQISYTGMTGTTNGTFTGLTRGLNGTTAAPLETNAFIWSSKLAKDNSDIHVMVDGAEQTYYSTTNASDSDYLKIWTVLSLSPKQEFTLLADISTTATSATITNNASNLSALQSIPDSGLVLMDSEVATYTALNRTYGSLGITFGKRGARGTTATSHLASTTVRWLEHDIVMFYGDIDLADQITNTTNQPIFDLTTSSNTYWVYNSAGFYKTSNSAAASNTGMWSQYELQQTNITVPEDVLLYPTSGSTTNPDSQSVANATFVPMGMQLKGNGTIGIAAWLLYHPAGITTATYNNGYKNSSNRTDWGLSTVATAGLDYSTNGSTWTNYLSIGRPAANNTWETWSDTTNIGNKNYIRVRLEAVNITTAETHRLEVYNANLSLVSTATPSVTLMAEQTLYVLNSIITNQTTGDYIAINYALPLNDSLEVDTDAHTVVYIDEGIAAREALSLSSVRQDWLRFASGANTLQYDETSVTGVTIDLSWEDRSI